MKTFKMTLLVYIALVASATTGLPMYSEGHCFMTTNKRVSDEIILASYSKLHNIWKVGKDVGLCGQSVWERLTRLGAIDNIRIVEPINKFKDYEVLQKKYLLYRDRGDLQLLADELGRTKHFICRKAKEIGLTSKIPYVKTKEQNAKIGAKTKDRFKKNGHPKGMLGKTHSAESSRKMSATRIAVWKGYSNEEKVIRTRKKMDAKLLKYGTLAPQHQRKVSWKQGWRIIYYFRSSWEYNYAIVLESLVLKGEIAEWNYETKTFTFDNEKSKVTYYMPDFEVKTISGNIEYHEVKGWMDARSILKLQLMAKWYPSVIIKVVDAKWFKENSHYKYSIIGWEK